MMKRKRISGIRAIGFDLFNTLIMANRQTLDEAIGRLMKSLKKDGFVENETVFMEEYGKAALWHIEQSMKTGRETHNRYWICDAVNRAGNHVSPDDPRIDRAVDSYFSAFYPNCRLIPGVGPMLEELKGKYPLGLASNFTHPPAARKIMEDLGLIPYFKTIIISGEIGYRKPDRVVFENLVKDLGVASHEILFMGDDPVADICGASAAGLHAVFLTYAGERRLPFSPEISDKDHLSPDESILRISTPEQIFGILDGSREVES
ncbi:MAG: HAD family hydrolase [Thermodesulfobacteriota bacterium]